MKLNMKERQKNTSIKRRKMQNNEPTKATTKACLISN